ncbi:MAG TPA: hemerythrin domain-containing protein [Bacillota bacterium]|nr:hemerythrin domain-containing protein [Bacillota bacterium]
MSNRNCDLILKQHQMIRWNIEHILGQLEELKKDPSLMDLEGLEYEIKQLIRLLEAHSICEEEILLPILKEMYQSQPDILQYVVEDHVVFQQELTALLDRPSSLQEKRRDIRSLLNRITVHFIEEEKGLLPLVDRFLLTHSGLRER